MPETLYLTVNLIDRYLLGSPVERSNLQLVGVSALPVRSRRASAAALNVSAVSAASGSFRSETPKRVAYVTTPSSENGFVLEGEGERRQEGEGKRQEEERRCERGR